MFLTAGITVSLLQYCVVKPYQLSDQGNSEGSTALPPHLQCMKCVIPDRQRYLPSEGLAGINYLKDYWGMFMLTHQQTFLA